MASIINENFFRIKSLGRGGFGVVWEVEEKVSEKHFALKVVKLDEEFNFEKSKREVDNIKEIFKPVKNGEVQDPRKKYIIDILNDWELLDLEDPDIEPWICPHWSSSDLPPIGFRFIQMEFCNRQNLAMWLKSSKTNKNLEEGRLIFDHIVQGLSFLHEKNCIHRDLKPCNILLTLVDGTTTLLAKIGDFGSSRIRPPNANSTLTVPVGTDVYCSPEQFNWYRNQQGQYEDYTTKSDIFSLGIILFCIHYPIEKSYRKEAFVYNDILVSLRQEDAVMPAAFCEAFPHETKILERMVSRNHKLRPTAREVIEFICSHWSTFPTASSRPIGSIMMKPEDGANAECIHQVAKGPGTILKPEAKAPPPSIQAKKEGPLMSFNEKVELRSFQYPADEMMGQNLHSLSKSSFHDMKYPSWVETHPSDSEDDRPPSLKDLSKLPRVSIGPPLGDTLNATTAPAARSQSDDMAKALSFTTQKSNPKKVDNMAQQSYEITSRGQMAPKQNSLNSQYNLKRQELLKQEAGKRWRQFEEKQKRQHEAGNAAAKAAANAAAAAAEKKSSQLYIIEGFPVTGNQHHTLTANKQNDISRPDEISWGHLIQLTKTTVVFHLGLHRTKMGIVNKHGVLQVLASVDNCLYFEGSQFVTRDADTAKNLKLGKRTPLYYLLVKNELDKLNEVRIEGATHRFRIEELMSFILATLKWETEFEQWWHIQNCLIVVPQFLNENQRQAVKDAAELAGFLHTTLINDTSAMALAYVMDQGVRDSQFITVNTLEGFIDAASFTIRYPDGSIDRNKVTGDTFVDVGSRGIFEYVSRVLFLGFGSTDSSRRAIFSHGELATTRKVTAILSSRQDDAKTLADSMSNVANSVEMVDSNYALMGAGYLIAIDSMDPDHKIYQKFAHTRRLTENTVQSFRDKLLHKNPDPVKKSANSSTALPLSANQMGFQEKKTKYYLRTTRALHTEKMRWLQLVHNVHHRLGDPRCHLEQIRREEIMDQLQAQRSAFKNLKAGAASQDTVLKAQMWVYSLLKHL